MDIIETAKTTQETSKQARGGLTLDLYAKICAEMHGSGAEISTVLRRNGITAAVWQAGYAAWNEAMGRDRKRRITSEYGKLYAKHSPAAKQTWPTRPELAVVNPAQSLTSEKEIEIDIDLDEYTFDDALAELKAETGQIRWTAAHALAEMIQTELGGDPRRKKQAMACVPHLIDCLTHYDQDSLGSAEAAARDLVQLGQLNQEVRSVMEHSLRRAYERLDAIKADSAARNKRNPERSRSQSTMRAYHALIETLQHILAG